MCTLIILNQIHQDYPVIVAANRDEFYRRPTRPPELIWSAPKVLAGVDEEAGGTWLGATESGFFVALTNQRVGGQTVNAPRSRGQVVLDLLKANDKEAARAVLRALTEGETRPFNLVFGDAEGLEVAYFHVGDKAVRIETMSPGLHVLPNGPLNSERFPKVKVALRGLEELDGNESWEELTETLQAVLANHDRPTSSELEPTSSMIPAALRKRLESLCVHAGVYGTRSSSLVALQKGRVARYGYADGAPCKTAFEDVLALLG